MAGHWTSQGDQAGIPTVAQWEKIGAAFGNFSAELDDEVRRVVWVEYEDAGGAAEYERFRAGALLADDATNPGPQAMALGRANRAATITSYVCACPTPDAPTTPAVIVDPFGGTGTVAGVAKTLGRFGISNDLSESYNRLAIWRITQSGHFTKTEQRAWADRQGSLL